MVSRWEVEGVLSGKERSWFGGTVAGEGGIIQTEAFICCIEKKIPARKQMGVFLFFCQPKTNFYRSYTVYCNLV